MGYVKFATATGLIKLPDVLLDLMESEYWLEQIGMNLSELGGEGQEKFFGQDTYEDLTVVFDPEGYEIYSLPNTEALDLYYSVIKGWYTETITNDAEFNKWDITKESSEILKWYLMVRATNKLEKMEKKKYDVLFE